MNGGGVELRRVAFGLTVVALSGAVASSQSPRPEIQALIDRAKSLELETPYVPPPGDPLSHHASGYAKIMCSAVFITGLDPEFAAENVGYFIAPYAERAKFRKPVIDPVNKAVHITVPNGVTRTAKLFGSQGCITLPEGTATLKFSPLTVKSALPDPSTQDWPMGDRTSAAPIPSGIDQRAKIRIADILRMSSGLRIRAPQDPDFDPKGPYPDHVYLYTGSTNSFRYAATRPAQWPPNTVGRYRNTDPVLINYLIRLGVEKRGEDYLSFPQRALFDKIGIRTMVIETDPFGNFLAQGAELASARDWARLGNLYLQDGVWNGERLLPEGYAGFVSTLAPAWEADTRPIYGAFFWINGDGALPVPKEAYMMSGAGGQTTLIIPSHDLVVVRMGHYKGSSPGGGAASSFSNALRLLMQAVPPKR